MQSFQQYGKLPCCPCLLLCHVAGGAGASTVFMPVQLNTNPFETIELFCVLFQEMTKSNVSMYANATTWCQMRLHLA